MQLFLPESGTSNPARLNRDAVPDGHHVYRTKPERARSTGFVRLARALLVCLPIPHMA
ncbi:hypothetical protein AGR7A_pAt30031 [Agrobacterium deltaense NCPPB 1641]|uniref:Uncharacterized protein n=1 Tax=Agrobacterium deltaense NCPPB 1641 TaxID=1183425 RepID=A0A1S7UC01_9HYPH|nr:hypothetical protein AGR7A_pAt30031 [Agrobacterium deltaense NCPPB 1641]